MNIRKFGWLCVCVLGTGCVTTRPMGWSVDDECAPLAANTATYRLSGANLPGFIESAVLFSADQALQKRGMVPSEEPDLEILVTFEYVNLDPEPRERDSFEEPLSSRSLTRFNTLTHVAVSTPAGRRLLSGSLHRAHAIVGNETFHTDRAVVMIQGAFEELFANLDRACIPEP